MLQHQETVFEECFSLELFFRHETAKCFPFCRKYSERRTWWCKYVSQSVVSQFVANILKHAPDGVDDSGTVQRK